MAGTKTGRRNLSGVVDVKQGVSNWEELNREQKFNIVYDKTLPLQVRLSNKLVYNLKKFESITSEDYLEVDDIIQECSLLLWKLLDIYSKLSYDDFLRLYKTSIWKAIYLHGISKAQLKKNACFTEPAISEVHRDSSPSSAPRDDLSPINDVALTSGFDALFDRMDMDWIKEGFNKFISNVPTITTTDKKIFNLISNPNDGFIDFCIKRSNSKKNNTKNIVNKSTIAEFLEVSPMGVGMSIKRITDTFNRYQGRSTKKLNGNNREVSQ